MKYVEKLLLLLLKTFFIEASEFEIRISLERNLLTSGSLNVITYPFWNTKLLYLNDSEEKKEYRYREEKLIWVKINKPLPSKKRKKVEGYTEIQNLNQGQNFKGK